MNRFIFLLMFTFFFVKKGKCQVKINADTILAQPNLQLNTTNINRYKAFLDSNVFLNNLPVSISNIATPKINKNQPNLFYLFISVLILLGLTRFFYPRYFTTLFKVFFNTSLKQSQLTDQLNQASIPALLFNLLFFVSSSLFLAILVKITNTASLFSVIKLASTFGGALVLCYIIKYLSLKLTGWVWQHQAEANEYLFIVFLVNKVMGIFLIPVSILLFYGNQNISQYVLFGSFMVIILLFLVRFFRSYTILQSKLKVSSFHFILYILCIEVLPIAVIYKAAMIYINKSM